MGLLGEHRPACRPDLRLVPHVSPGEEHGRVGVSLPASPCSQFGAYLVSFFMGDKEGIDLFVQVPLVQ